jgi:acyl carrier protein
MNETSLIKDKIKELISKTYFVNSSDIIDNQSLTDQGFLDSKNILQLIILIELNFGIQIDINNVSIDNFESVDKISEYINQHK